MKFIYPCFFLTVQLFACIQVSFSANPYFTANKGQIVDQGQMQNKNVLFLCNSSKGINVQLRQGGYSYEFFSPCGASNNVPSKKDLYKNTFNTATLKSSRIDVDFIGMDPSARIVTAGPADFVSNYIINDHVASGVQSWKKVTYKNAYPFTDLEFIATGDEASPVKYNIILYPGSNLKKVKLLISGCEAVEKNGNIIFKTSLGTVSEKIPYSFYADSPGSVKDVSFKLAENIISFEAEVDASRTFVIDPATLVWGTYFGGNAYDVSTGTGIDGQNNIYTCGYTQSASNIASSGAFQNTISVGPDIFITKFSSNGARIWSSYFGAGATDIAYAIAVQQDGKFYLTGGTSSTVNIATAGAHQVPYGGGINDIVLAKFDANGQRLWSTYYGGNAHDIAQAITIDKSGNVLISGHTESTGGIATPGAYKTIYNFNYDVCLAKFNAGGTLLWGTYYGDSGVDEAYGMTTDTLENIYITGGTASISDISTPGSHQLFSGGQLDGFIAKFNPTGSGLIWGTYYGGQSNDAGTVIEISKTGQVFVGGTTTSSTNISTPGSYQLAPASFDEAFLAAFTSAGARLWGTYFGGEDVEYVNDMILTQTSEVLFCGSTTSSLSISTAGAHQASLSSVGFYDAYFAMFSASGNKQLATYYGGEGNDVAWGMTLDNIGRLYLAGESTSTTGISTAGCFQPLNSGGTDALLAKFCIPFKPLLFPASTATVCRGSITLSTTPGFTSYLWNTGATVNPVTVSVPAPGNYSFSVVVNDGPDCTGKSDTMRVTVLSCVGIDEMEKNVSLSIYPSPAGDYLYFQLSGLSAGSVDTYEIYSSLGNQVLAFEIADTSTINSIDLSSLPTGFYILCLKSKGIIIQRKFARE